MIKFKVQALSAFEEHISEKQRSLYLPVSQNFWSPSISGKVDLIPVQSLGSTTPPVDICTYFNGIKSKTKATKMLDI